MTTLAESQLASAEALEESVLPEVARMPRVSWFPRSRMNVRIMRGPNCWEASVSAKMVMEKTTPITVITAAAMAIRI